jgi:hypothetical protein
MNNINIDLPQITTGVAVVVPLILAIVQAIKLTGKVPNQYSPIVSIGVGIILAFLAHGTMTAVGSTVLSGVMYGLMASGLYSGIKTTMPATQQAQSKANKASAKNRQNDEC